MSKLLTIQGIVIPYGHVMAEGPYDFSGIRAQREDSMGGVPNVWESDQYGRVFTISGTDKLGIKKEIVDQVYALSIIKNAVWQLHYYGEDFLVRFTHEDRPVMGSTPIWNRPDGEAGDMHHSFFMKLMEVG